MGDRDNTLPQHDLEVEITNLDATCVIKSSSRFSRVLRLLWTLPLPLRQRLAQCTLVVSVVVLSALMVLGNFPTARSVTASMFFSSTPTPTPTLISGVDLFYFDANPPWGRLFVDGKPLAHIPIIHVDAPLQLPRGHHVLDWQADPFQVQHCTVSVPPNFTTDTCQFADVIQQGVGLLSAWVIKFSVSLSTVSSMVRNTLIQTVQTALDAEQSTETVWPGEEYALAPIEPGNTRTNQPLKAVLHFQLDTNPRSDAFCTGLGPIGPRACDCLMFCTAPWLAPASSSTREWDVLAVIHAGWTYTTLDGKFVASDQPDASGNAIGLEHLAPFRLLWDGNEWHAVALFTGSHGANRDITNPICASARDDVQLNGPLKQLPPTGTFMDWSFVSGVELAAGCLAIATPDQGPQATPSFRQPIAYCLHRFGIFVAVNDVAHKFWPTMPVADTYEQSVAQYLLALYKNMSA
jgi:hypothetical protein